MVKVMLGSRCLPKEDVLRLISKLKRFTTTQDREKFDKLVRKEIYHYHEVKTDCNSLIDTLWKLIQVIDEKRPITITYYKMNREAVKRKIKPVSLMFSEYYFYLIAYAFDDDQYLPKFFRADRIVSMTEHQEHFTLERKYDFDEGDLREKNQFLFPGKTERIRFAFSGLSVLIFQKIHHLLGISALCVLCKDTLSAVLFSSATAKNGFKLILWQRKSSGHGIFHTCFRCCDCSDLLLKRRKQAELCKGRFRCFSPEKIICVCYRL